MFNTAGTEPVVNANHHRLISLQVYFPRVSLLRCDTGKVVNNGECSDRLSCIIHRTTHTSPVVNCDMMFVMNNMPLVFMGPLFVCFVVIKWPKEHLSNHRADIGGTVTQYICATIKNTIIMKMLYYLYFVIL